MKKGLLIFLFLFAFSLAGCSFLNVGSVSKVITPAEAKAKAEKFINENLVEQGSTVTIGDVTEENGLYKIPVKLASGQTVDSFLSKDGSKFYPQSYDVDKPADQNTNAAASNTTPASQPIPKNDKPVVELFVMAYCPYGTQAEKGILPVVNTLKDKINFQVKFCDYSMHGKQEVDEQLNQYCIETEQSGKYLSYLKCFLDAGKGADCLKSTGIDETKMKTCVGKTDNIYKVSANYNDKNTWLSGKYPLFDVNKTDNTKYSVKGSPTLVINGVEASAGRDAASLLQAICGVFNTQPEECKTQLSATAPSTGFGFDASGPNSAASCGN
ncbi:MAG: hypothetical protein NTX82_01220 [Candidatus Parcubacteria bacterium]|nr:hypothetical protein [Candidatus Parcubacteria bacterium]